MNLHVYPERLLSEYSWEVFLCIYLRPSGKLSCSYMGGDASSPWKNTWDHSLPFTLGASSPAPKDSLTRELCMQIEVCAKRNCSWSDLEWRGHTSHTTNCLDILHPEESVIQLVPSDALGRQVPQLWFETGWVAGEEGVGESQSTSIWLWSPHLFSWAGLRSCFPVWGILLS
jgi:hypothetical protein